MIIVGTTNYKQNIAIIELYLPHTSTSLNNNIRMLKELLILLQLYYSNIIIAGFKQC